MTYEARVGSNGEGGKRTSEGAKCLCSKRLRRNFRTRRNLRFHWGSSSFTPIHARQSESQPCFHSSFTQVPCSTIPDIGGRGKRRAPPSRSPTFPVRPSTRISSRGTPGMQYSCFSTASPRHRLVPLDGDFAIDVAIRTPVGAAPNICGYIKPLLDGIVAACHSAPDVPDDAVTQCVAGQVGQPSEVVWRWFQRHALTRARHFRTKMVAAYTWKRDLAAGSTWRWFGRVGLTPWGALSTYAECRHQAPGTPRHLLNSLALQSY